MAWLFLDTHTPRLSRFAWLEPGEEARATEVEGRSNVLLPKLAKDAKRFAKLEGVCVVAGPGSFSSVRTGVLYANLLARVKRIPLVGIRVEDAQDLDGLTRALYVENRKAETAEYVAPIYDAEPNITLPKRGA